MAAPTPVSLGIDLQATFDERQALTMADAARLLRGRRGNPAVAVLRRWASPKRGCRVGQLVLLFPAIKHGGQLLTMPAWVAAQRRAEERLRQAGFGV